MSNANDFVIENGVLKKYKGSGGNVVVPEGVTSIGDLAFHDCESLQSITLPEGVTSIGNSAFWWCENLQSITLPEGVTSIGDSAFYECKSLQSITLPESVTSIGYQAFYECESLQSITLPKGVTSIGWHAFWGCVNLQSITLPEGVTSIGDSAFSGCKSLQSITLPESVTSIGNSAFRYCENLQSITLPEGVTSIEHWTFMGCERLTEVKIDPDNAHFTAENGLILSKDREKLICCVPGLADTVIVPDSVRYIGRDAFSNCKKIEKIVLPKELEYIERAAFSHCDNLKEINLPEKVEGLPEDCFYGCSSLGKVDLSHISYLGKGAFNYCKSLRITVPSNIDVLSESTFVGCTLKNIHFEEGAGEMCYGQGPFSESVQAKKELKTYPNLPLHLFNKSSVKLWLVMGYCTDPDAYSGYIKKEYEQYAKSQKKRILKKALDDNQTKVLSYYGESILETTPGENRESEGQVSLSMTKEQAKKLFKFTKRKTGISINEFKTIDRWRHGSYFSEGVSNKLILPEYIDGEPVGHIALTVLPDNAVVFCSDLVFQRLKRPVRTLTACAYLENSTEFPEKECSEIQKYVAKYSADVADKLIETANVQAVSRFLELVKLTPKLCDEMLKKAEGNVELTALILERKYAQCNSL